MLNRGNGAEPKSLDPHYTEGTWEAAITGDLMYLLIFSAVSMTAATMLFRRTL